MFSTLPQLILIVSAKYYLLTRYNFFKSAEFTTVFNTITETGKYLVCGG